VKKNKTPSQDINPQSIKFGKWIIRPLNINTLILLEKIGSPFVADDFDAKALRFADGRKMTMEEMIRSFYILVTADDPRLDEQVNDPVMFQRCVSAMAREISMADLAKMTSAINEQMSQVNQAIKETSAEGETASKKETGPAS